MKTARVVLALLKRTLFLLRRPGRRDGPRLLALASDAVLSLFKSRELDYPDVQLLRTITSRPHAALKHFVKKWLRSSCSLDLVLGTLEEYRKSERCLSRMELAAEAASSPATPECFGECPTWWARKSFKDKVLEC